MEHRPVMLLPDQVRLRLEDLHKMTLDLVLLDLIGLLEDVLPDLVALAQKRVPEGNYG